MERIKIFIILSASGIFVVLRNKVTYQGHSVVFIITNYDDAGEYYYF